MKLLLPNVLILQIVLSMVLLGCNERKKSTIEVNSNEFDIDMRRIVSIADSLYQNESYFEATQAYTNLIKLDSTNGEYYYRRAYSLCQVERDRESLKDFQKAIDLNYDKFKCFHSIGLVHMLLNNDSMAIQYFEKCLLIKPNDSNVITFLRKLKSRQS
jgi:tetratricopeptide (TPR) repeat protein